jgi:CheY-like chemotaxis protein
VIVCDLHMPGMDVCVFPSALKERAGFRHIPVIAITGSESDAALIRTLEAGLASHQTRHGRGHPGSDQACAEVFRRFGMTKQTAKRKRDQLGIAPPFSPRAVAADADAGGILKL